MEAAQLGESSLVPPPLSLQLPLALRRRPYPPRAVCCVRIRIWIHLQPRRALLGGRDERLRLRRRRGLGRRLSRLAPRSRLPPAQNVRMPRRRQLSDHRLMRRLCPGKLCTQRLETRLRRARIRTTRGRGQSHRLLPLHFLTQGLELRALMHLKLKVGHRGWRAHMLGRSEPATSAGSPAGQSALELGDALGMARGRRLGVLLLEAQLVRRTREALLELGARLLLLAQLEVQVRAELR